MSATPHLNELGEFLKARRAELSPRAVGLPDGPGPRRVRGLRREEVAGLAAISTDYYTRLEQGRMPASAPVLEAVAEVLHLDDDQRRYLFGLAGKETARPRRRTLQKVQPQLRRVLDDLTSTPAVVMGRRMDVIAWNPLAAALITDFAAVPDKHRNYLRVLFTDPAMRTLYADWRKVARTAVAQLRMEAAKYPDDPRLTGLVGELSVQDPDFRTWWAAHHVAPLSVGTKVLNHPVAGELSLAWDTLTASTDPDQQLVVWTAEAGSPTHDRLRILASWEAGRRGAGPSSRRT
ncbi:helix-turn-helix domain-containing protein [Streptomyces sp. NPDC127020]|uniref:helix-turn-helix domain-containing protein n=1 Tax=Streptomyces sp. NPDC127020 TaxID=3347109 RepID=UPI00365222F7